MSDALADLQKRFRAIDDDPYFSQARDHLLAAIEVAKEALALLDEKEDELRSETALKEEAEEEVMKLQEHVSELKGVIDDSNEQISSLEKALANFTQY